MFLSKLTLNPRDRQVRFELARPYEMHKTIWNQFPSLRKNQSNGENLDRILFRVDNDRHRRRPFVLVQSEIETDWQSLPIGYLARPAEWKQYDPSFAIGQRLRFHLRANPTKRVALKNERLGNLMARKRIGLLTEADQIRWLVRKGDNGGFRLPGEWIDAKDPLTGEPKQIPNFRADAIPEGHQSCGKEDHRDGEFLAVRFDGVLTITDPAIFRMTLQKGIGSAKGFGFGLLSIAPAEVMP